MQETRAQTTKKKLAKTYGIGILVFSAIVGFITLLANFLTHLKST